MSSRQMLARLEAALKESYYSKERTQELIKLCMRVVYTKDQQIRDLNKKIFKLEERIIQQGPKV